MRFRLIIALLVGLFFAVVCYRLQSTPFYQSAFPSYYGGDFFWAMRSARDLMAGRDPYAYPYHIMAIPYPLTAALIGMPFSIFPDRFGGALFFGISSGILAYVLAKDSWKLLLFASPAYWQCLFSVQFVPLLLAIPFLPFLSPLVLVKPQVGLPIALQTRWGKVTILITSLFLLLTLLLYPSWPLRWISQIGPYSGFIPLFTIAGPVLLLALLSWHTRRARIFLLLTIVPQQIFFYDQLLLWVLPETFREMLFLNLVSWPAYFLALHYSFPGKILILIFFYLPMLIIILKNRRRTALTIEN